MKDPLRSLYQSRPAVRTLFVWLSTHGSDGRRLTVEELVENTQLNRRESVAVLRELETHGCGRFKVGRKGHVSRFEWHVDPQALAERVLGSLDDPDGDELMIENDASSTNGSEPHEHDGHERSHPDAAELGEVLESMIEHAYMLRPDIRIALRLPVDLTPREAEVLAAWIHNLSFKR